MSIAVRRHGSSARSSATDEVDPVQRRVLCRAINEQVYEMRSFSSTREIDIVCECGRPSCFETLRTSSIIYQDVRLFPTRFLVKAGHLDPTSERAIVGVDQIVVVDRIRPDDAEAAIRADPGTKHRFSKRRLVVVGERVRSKVRGHRL